MQRVVIALFFVVTLCFSAAAAQDAYESPLLTLMASVPDTPNTRTELLFNDRAAIAAAYPPAQMPANFAEFDAVLNDDADGALNLWYVIFRNTATARMAVYIGVADEMPGLVGFDFFDIQQELNYSMPPQQVLHISGAFDLETVRAALTDSEYQAVDTAVGELWCLEAACDTGAMMDFEARNPANPFGGELGRRFPLFITSSSIIGSPDEDTITAHIGVAAEEVPSIAEAPDYAAAVELLTRDGVLMQAAFYPPEATQPAVMPSDGLPAYRLFALGDVATNEAQQALVILVYEDEGEAERAAELLPTLLDLPSERGERPWRTILEQSQINEITSEVVITDAGLSAVVLTLSGARGTPEQILEVSDASSGTEPDFTLPGQTFRAVMNGLLSRDLPWLAIAN